MATLSLMIDQELVEAAVALFESGWTTFVWLLQLAQDYGTLAPGPYYTLPPQTMVLRLVVSLAPSFVIVHLLRKRKSTNARKMVGEELLA